MKSPYVIDKASQTVLVLINYYQTIVKNIYNIITKKHLNRILYKKKLVKC